MATFTVDTNHQTNLFVSSNTNDTYARAQFEIIKNESTRTFSVRFNGASTYSKYDWGFAVTYDIWISRSNSSSTANNYSIKYNAPYSGGDWEYVGWWPTTKISVGSRKQNGEVTHKGTSTRFSTASGSGNITALDGSGYRVSSTSGNPKVDGFKFDDNGNPEKVYVKVIAKNTGKLPDEDTGKLSANYWVNSGFIDISKNVGTITANKIDVSVSPNKSLYPQIGATKNKIAWIGKASANSDNWQYSLDGKSFASYANSGSTANGEVSVTENTTHTLSVKAKRAGTNAWGSSSSISYDLRKPSINNSSLNPNGDSSGKLLFSTGIYEVAVFFGRKGDTYTSYGALSANGNFNKDVVLTRNYKGSYGLRLERTDCRSIINEITFDNVDTIPAKIELKVKESYPIATTVVLEGKSDKDINRWHCVILNEDGTEKYSGNIYPNENDSYRTESRLVYSRLVPGKRYTATFDGFSKSNIKTVSNQVSFIAHSGVNILDKNSGDSGTGTYRIAGVYIFNSSKNKWEVYDPYVFDTEKQKWIITLPD